MTFEIFKNPITLKDTGYPPITVIRVTAWTILVPRNCVSFIPSNSGMENVRDSRAPGNAYPKHTHMKQLY